jgi:hypothetical protein
MEAPAIEGTAALDAGEFGETVAEQVSHSRELCLFPQLECRSDQLQPTRPNPGLS